MNIFAYASIFVAFFCLALGSFVLYINRKVATNQLFFLTIILGFIYSSSTVMMWSASTAEDALIWHKIGTIWPLFCASVLHFALVFTGNKWFKKKMLILVLYLPATAFFLIDLLTYYINTAPVMQPWGYNDLAANTWIYVVSSFWSAFLSLLAFSLCFRYTLKSKEEIQRKRGLLVSIGLFIPILTFILTNMLIRGLNISMPNLGILSTLFFAIFVGYAIIQYDLFVIDAALTVENLVSTIPDSLILATAEANILKVNKPLTKFSGYTEGEMKGQSINKLFIEKNECRIFLEKLFNEQTIHNHEIILRTKTGQKRCVLLSGSVIKSKTGHPLGLTLVIHDITARKNMEERLVKAERQASIGELANQLAHDLRNPLAGIRNGVYLVKEKGTQIAEHERNEILDIVVEAVEDSNRIVSSLIDYSSELELKKEWCTPKAVIDKVLSQIETPNYVTIKNEIYDNAELYLDRPRMEMVFTRIIKNSIEAIQEKGEIQIQSSQENAELSITFADTGRGIPQEVLPKLFSALVTTKAKGMGMSLAICKRIVEAHRGKITVESKLGVGTKLTITLPLKQKEVDMASIIAQPRFL